MPIELGDIFRKESGGKEFVLLGQPCDLMIRSNGKRNSAIIEAELATIISDLPTDGEGNQTGHEAHYELPYYDSKETRFVSFRKSQAVRLWILDLCVYQSDGSATYRSGDPLPDSTVPAWKLYHEKLAESAGDVIDKYVQLHDALSGGSFPQVDRILRQAVPDSSNGDLFKGKVNPVTRTLEYGFKRIGRLSQPYAAALLTKYANYYSRAAFDHDFGRET